MDHAHFSVSKSIRNFTKKAQRKGLKMKTNTKLTIAAAALTGLLAGAASRASAATTTSRDSSTKLVAAGHQVINLDDTDKNACKGQNSCKGKGFLEMSKADCAAAKAKAKDSK
jgi:hypothetical protein